QTGLAGRTDTADQWHPRRPAPVPRPRRGTDSHPLPSSFLPADLALETTSAAATEPALERTVRWPAPQPAASSCQRAAVTSPSARSTADYVEVSDRRAQSPAPSLNTARTALTLRRI